MSHHTGKIPGKVPRKIVKPLSETHTYCIPNLSRMARKYQTKNSTSAQQQEENKKTSSVKHH